MTQSERTALTQIVERCKAINAELQALKREAKGLTESAWDKAGVRPKVVKQLAKEAAWDQVQREEQRQHEEALDTCRAALGMLADLPLGQAAQQDYATHSGNEQSQPVKRARGRPPGAKNKPKLATSDGAMMPPPPDVPDIPSEVAA